MIDGFMASKIVRTEYNAEVCASQPVYEYGNVYDGTVSADRRQALPSNGTIGALRTLVSKGLIHLLSTQASQSDASLEDQTMMPDRGTLLS